MTRRPLIVVLVVSLALLLPVTDGVGATEGSSSPADAAKKKKKKKKKCKRVKVKKKGKTRLVKKCKKAKKKNPARVLPKSPGSLNGTFGNGTTSQGERFSLTIAGGQVTQADTAIRATCFNSADNSSTLEYHTLAISGPFPIGGDGSFAGEDTADNPSGARYKVSGTLAGGQWNGGAEVAWEVVQYDVFTYSSSQKFCSGQVTWTMPAPG